MVSDNNHINVAVKLQFLGGEISFREAGSMFDQKSGKMTSWDEGIKIISGKGQVVVNRDFVKVFQEFVNQPRVRDYLEGH